MNIVVSYRWAYRNAVIDIMTTSDFSFTFNQRAIFSLQSSTKRILIASVMLCILIIGTCHSTTPLRIQINLSIDVALQEICDFVSDSRR